MKHFLQFTTAILLAAAPATVGAQSYDANPTTPFTYGSGNGYTPANAVVLTGTGSELALRAHVPLQVASTTGGTGTYVFDLGSAVSFDFSVFGTALPGANITITNLLTGDDASYAAALLGSLQPSGALQGSQQLGFGFLNGGLFSSENIAFNPNQNNTYRINLTGGGQSISAFAQIGSGVGAVPEPATWAMMLIGFGAIGATMRRRKPAIGLQLA